MKTKFRYSDFDKTHSLTKDLGFYDVAVAQCFGIAAGWVSEDEIAKMFPDELDKIVVYQIACMICSTALRRAIPTEELDSMKSGPEMWTEMLHGSFGQEAPCHHFEQFTTFRSGLEKDGEYANAIHEAIIIQARLLEATA